MVVLMQIFLPVDRRINKKRFDKFRLKTVIAVSPDPCAFAVFPHNSQLTKTLEHPERTARLYFPPLQKPGSSSTSEAPGLEPNLVI